MRFRLDTGVLDPASRQLLTPDGTAVTLSPMEARVVTFLAARRGAVVTQDTLLGEVWGYSSAVETRTVRTTMNRLRNKLERDPSAPRHVLTEHGEGYRFVAEPVAEEEVATVVPTFGREVERAALAAANGWLVTLTGPPGVGRSHLARVGVPKDFVWVDSSDATHAEALYAAIVHAVGRDALEPRAAAVRAVSELRRFVLDDLDAGLDGLAMLHDQVPDARFVVTARAATGLPGEQILPVGPLPPSDARALLAHHLQAADLTRVVQPDDPDLLRVVEALDRVPLAVLLAAPWVDLLGASALAERLSKIGLGAVPEAERAVTAAVRLSWDRLDDEDRDAALALSCCAGEVDLDLAERVIGRPDALSSVRRLLAASLLSRVGPGRVVLLRGVRRALPRDDASLAVAADRHVEALLALDPTDLRALERVRDELDLALSYALRRRPDAVAPLVLALDHLLMRRGTTEAHLALLDRVGARLDPISTARMRARALRLAGRIREAIAALGAVPPEAPAESWIEVGRCAMINGDLSRAANAFDTAIRLVRDPVAHAQALGGASGVARAHGRAAEAEALAREALAVLPLAAVEERVAASCELGESLSDAGLADEAGDVLQTALEAAEQAGYARMVAIAALRLATARQSQGRIPEAEQALYRSVDASIATGSLRNELLARLRLVHLGLQHRAADLSERIREARRVEQLAPDRSVRGWIGIDEALHRLDLGEPDVAATLFDRALELFDDDAFEEQCARMSRAWLLIQRGDRRGALDVLEPLINGWRAGGAAHPLANALLIAALASEGAAAKRYLAEARTLAATVPELASLADVVDAAATGRSLPAELSRWTAESVQVRLALSALRRPVPIRAVAEG